MLATGKTADRSVRRSVLATLPERLLAVPTDRLTPRLSMPGGLLVMAVAALLCFAIFAALAFSAIHSDLSQQAKFRKERLQQLAHTAKADLVSAGNLLVGECSLNNIETLTRSSMSSVLVKSLLWTSVEPGVEDQTPCSPFRSIHDPVVDQFQGQITRSISDGTTQAFRYLRTRSSDLLIVYRVGDRGYLGGLVSGELVHNYLNGNYSADPIRVQLQRSDGGLLHDTSSYVKDQRSDEVADPPGWLSSWFMHSTHIDADNLTIVAWAAPHIIAAYAARYSMVALLLTAMLTAFSIAQINMALAGRASVERRLRQAVRRREFEPVIQPIVNAQTGQCQGGEILMRWLHPARGLLSPFEFLEVAEKTGLIDPMTEVIMTKARDQLSDVLKSEPSLYFSFNITVEQLRHPDVIDWLDQMFDETALPPANVVIELVERDAVDARASQTLSQLRRRGYRVAIDDFGTGESSLALLAGIDFDTLKIDREFVRSVDEESVNRPVLTAIIDLANQLGVHTIAEGVETVAQHEFLVAKGVDSIQGFLIARPMPIADFSQWLYAHKHKPAYTSDPDEAESGQTDIAIADEAVADTTDAGEGDVLYAK